jgi:hypothetical protein
MSQIRTADVFLKIIRVLPQNVKFLENFKFTFMYKLEGFIVPYCSVVESPGHVLLLPVIGPPEKRPLLLWGPG